MKETLFLLLVVILVVGFNVWLRHDTKKYYKKELNKFSKNFEKYWESNNRNSNEMSGKYKKK